MNPWFYAFLLAALAAGALHLRWHRRWTALQKSLLERERQAAAFGDQSERAAVATEAQQRALFDSMSEGVLLVDDRGTVQLVNRSLQSMFALSREVRGQTVLEAFRLTQLDDLLARLQKEPAVQGLEMELPGMEERWLEVNAAAIVDPQHNRRGAILVFHDLTQIKQLENTRQEFVANVSHELRTPLSLIKGYVETLLENDRTDADTVTRFLQTIEKHTDRLTFLIEDILTISKLESGQIAMNCHPVELRHEAARVAEDLGGPARERDVSIHNEVPEGLVVEADADRLEQVFFNLVENAIKYGRKGGRVRLGAQAQDTRKIEIWIEDDGPGIPVEAQERIFERFYRVDRARSRETGGTGLGLSIVKHIVQAHGGEVWVRSQPGQGTTFHFTLPASPSS